MPFADCKLGQWYVVITCESCGTRQPLYPDPSEGKAKVSSTIAQCANCGRLRLYQVEDLERYQHSHADAGSDDVGDSFR